MRPSEALIAVTEGRPDVQAAAFQRVAGIDIATALALLDRAYRALDDLDGIDTEAAEQMVERCAEVESAARDLAGWIAAKVDDCGGRGPEAALG